MRIYSLLWLYAGANVEEMCCKADSPEQAADAFKCRAPGMVNGYQKFESGGAWCVAENYTSF